MLLPVSAVTIRLPHDDDTVSESESHSHSQSHPIRELYQICGKVQQNGYFYTNIRQIIIFHSATLSRGIYNIALLLASPTAEMLTNLKIVQNSPQTYNTVPSTLNGNAE